MMVAVASGKGGVGKTTVAVNLARTAAMPVQLLDCDVEEPNAHLFLPGTPAGEETVYVRVPVVDASRCDGCGECGRFCEYHAIVALGNTPLIFPEMCHGCGGCARVCPRQAIQETDRRIGIIRKTQAGDILLVQGCLDVGVAMAPPLIRAVKARITGDRPVVLDAPPGTACPVVATLRGADYAVLVTEPTPFGLHDLTLVMDTARELGVPFGVVVNRMGIGDDRVQAFCRPRGIPILLELPEDRRIADVCSTGGLLVEALPEYRERFQSLIIALRLASAH
jgi:MinD superfamily P-loop ATPase